MKPFSDCTVHFLPTECTDLCDMPALVLGPEKRRVDLDAVRENLGFDVAGLTTGAAERLNAPFDLIFKWVQYVPLGSLLQRYEAEFIADDNENGTMTLRWSLFGDGDHVVPSHLLRRTRAQADLWDLKRGRRKMFRYDGRDITLSDVSRAISALLAGEREA